MWWLRIRSCLPVRTVREDDSWQLWPCRPVSSTHSQPRDLRPTSAFGPVRLALESPEDAVEYTPDLGSWTFGFGWGYQSLLRIGPCRSCWGPSVQYGALFLGKRMSSEPGYQDISKGRSMPKPPSPCGVLGAGWGGLAPYHIPRNGIDGWSVYSEFRQWFHQRAVSVKEMVSQRISNKSGRGVHSPRVPLQPIRYHKAIIQPRPPPASFWVQRGGLHNSIWIFPGCKGLPPCFCRNVAVSLRALSAFA